MHAASEDLRICRFQTGTVPRRVYDVQIAAGLVGFGYPLSLGNLVSQALRISLPGGETRTDWRRSPSTPAQVRYALDDVRHLLDLADLIASQLAQRTAPTGPRRSSRSSPPRSRTGLEEDRWRRLPGLHQLNRRGLEIARRLAEWRYEEARRTNRPLRQLLRDDLLVAIAKPPADLASRPGAPPRLQPPPSPEPEHRHPGGHRRGPAVPRDQLPEPPDRHEEGPGLIMVVNLLAATMARCCAQHKVAFGLVGVATTKELIRWHPTTAPSSVAPNWPGAGATRSAARPSWKSSPVAAPSASWTRSPTFPWPWNRSAANPTRACREPPRSPGPMPIFWNVRGGS